MDGSAIVLIVLVIVGLMFTAITLFAVIVRSGERVTERERPRIVYSPAPVGRSVRDAADNFSEGLRLLRNGDFPAAVQEFSAAITVDSNHWTAYFRRAEAYRNLGLEELAGSDLAKAEFLMTAVRQETEESGASSDGVVADTSDGTIISAMRRCVGCGASGCMGCLGCAGAIVVFYIIILIILAVSSIIAAILP